VRESANEVARAGTTKKSADIAKKMVELREARLDIKANVTVIKTEDEILGNLFDGSA
jgi:hypothetical protein